MKMYPYVVICKDEKTEEISHTVVECHTRLDARLEIPDTKDVLYMCQTDDVEEAYAWYLDFLDGEYENILRQGKELKVLADKVDGVLRKMMVD
jgi:hypothetical protein